MSAAKGVQRVIGEETHLFARATRIYRDLYQSHPCSSTKSLNLLSLVAIPVRSK